MGDGERYSGGSGGLFDPDRSWDVAVDHILDVGDEQEWLEHELARIDQQLEKRDEIHEKIVDELKWQIELYADRLERLDSKWQGTSEELEQVKQRLHMFYEELREEHREHWQDRQRLEDERRQVLRELDRIDTDYLSEV